MNHFTLPKLSDYRRTKLLAYAQQILESQQFMTSEQGKNIIHYTLEQKERHESMIHYPKGDRIDHQSGAQYFYHCHREDLESMEHGHFHCFLRYKGIPKRIKPTSLEDWDKYLDNPMTHLVAISMSCLGQPIRLFTVNRWISEEVWYDAEHNPSFIKRYKLNINNSSYWEILDKWVEGMLHLFSPQIAWLHQERDLKIRQYQQENPQTNIYEDERFEELSSISINLPQQIEWLLQKEKIPAYA